MKSFILNNGKCFCLRLDKGEEIVSSLTTFCKKHKITSGSLYGIGATNNVILGCFELKQKKYKYKTIKKSLEILSLVGNISSLDNSPFIHAHIVVSADNFCTYGGHLKCCVVSLTCEIYLTAYDCKIKRLPNKNLGISILN